jgi:hypothetical protein
MANEQAAPEALPIFPFGVIISSATSDMIIAELNRRKLLHSLHPWIFGWDMPLSSLRCIYIPYQS